MSDTTNKNTNNAGASVACVSDAPVFWSAGPVRNQQATTVLARRNVMKIAGWNVCTLRDEGTQSLTVRTLHKYGVCVSCLSEVRLPDSGHRIIKVPESDCVYHLYHSGVEDNSGLYGVAIALSPVAQAALLAWEPVSHRLAMVRLKGAVINVTVISVYTPTLNATEEEKDIFYRDLQAVVDRTPSTDLLVAGDWNTRTGPGADTGSAHGSDHTLVRASLRLRLRERRSTKITKRINVANLKLRAGEQFRLELHNRFSLLQPSSEPQPETEWQALKSATVEAAHAHLGVTRRRYRDWITFGWWRGRG